MEQKVYAFSGSIVPLSAAISCTEPQYKRIFTFIGAGNQHSAFFEVAAKSFFRLILVLILSIFNYSLEKQNHFQVKILGGLFLSLFKAVVMKTALIQSSLFWKNPAANRNHFEEKISAIDETVDLIVLPEMFSTGFTMNPSAVAETMQGETIAWLKHLAVAKNAAITGSLVITEKGNFYNRLVFVFPSGEIQFYDKRHLFTLAGEDEVYTAGSKKLIVEYKGWKICPLICYDLRFPVFARNVEEYDVLVYVANWPKTRITAWDALLKARAIENMSYTIGVNRIGEDENKYEYNGHSQVVNFLGEYLMEPIETKGVFIVELNKAELLLARRKFNFLNDRDSFVLKS